MVVSISVVVEGSVSISVVVEGSVSISVISVER